MIPFLFSHVFFMLIDWLFLFHVTSGADYRERSLLLFCFILVKMFEVLRHHPVMINTALTDDPTMHCLLWRRLELMTFGAVSKPLHQCIVQCAIQSTLKQFILHRKLWFVCTGKTPAFYSYTDLTFLDTSVFVLFTAALSITIAPWSLLWKMKFISYYTVNNMKSCDLKCIQR